jgi:hypothetical protein
MAQSNEPGGQFSWPFGKLRDGPFQFKGFGIARQAHAHEAVVMGSGRRSTLANAHCH